MLQALVASAGRAVAGRMAAGVAAEGAATSATTGGAVETAKKLLAGGSNHNSPPQGSVEGMGASDIRHEVANAFDKALGSTGPGTDLSGSNNLYRSF